MTPEAMAQCRTLLEQLAEDLAMRGMNRADVATLFCVTATKLTVAALGAQRTAEILRNTIAALQAQSTGRAN